VVVRFDVPLAPLTTLRLGGMARRMVDLERLEDIASAARESMACAEPMLVLGGGSNLVVGDDGFPGLVALMRLKGIHARREGSRVVVDVAAGEDWDTLVAQAVAEGWSGLECLSGIPGLVGATPIQNVGAYGCDASQMLTRVRAFDRMRAMHVDLEPRECAFGYRTSVFKGNDRWIVTGIELTLHVSPESAPIRYDELARALALAPGARAPASRVRETVLALRRTKGMVVDPDDPESVSAGSFFVNPVLDRSALAELEVRAGVRPPCFDDGHDRFKVAAAWLVERAGFPKGWGKGRVGVSRKHALALVNRGGATTRELLALAREIRDGVWQRFGVRLAPEPVLVGRSWEEDGLEGDE
jgi:UDP-N-acetylmuramate dehydrogenase